MSEYLIKQLKVKVIYYKMNEEMPTKWSEAWLK